MWPISSFLFKRPPHAGRNTGESRLTLPVSFPRLTHFHALPLPRWSPSFISVRLSTAPFPAPLPHTHRGLPEQLVHIARYQSGGQWRLGVVWWGSPAPVSVCPPLCLSLRWWKHTSSLTSLKIRLILEIDSRCCEMQLFNYIRWKLGFSLRIISSNHWWKVKWNNKLIQKCQKPFLDCLRRRCMQTCNPFKQHSQAQHDSRLLISLPLLAAQSQFCTET